MKISTYTLIARDPKTGDVGIIGGTNWFCYGRWVPHIEAGYGAIATQAETNMWYGPNGIENLKKGLSATTTLADLLNRDPDINGVYQLLILDNNGGTASYTGKNNHFYAGHICENNLVVGGNTLVSEETLKAVISSYKTSQDIDFEMKLIKAMQAGQNAGGDIRGMKSAALKIAKATGTGKYWNDIVYDLRVDESKDPLAEIERLYYVAKAYSYISDAESEDNLDNALEYYQKGLDLDKTNTEIKFWMARIYAQKGNYKESDKLREEIRKVNTNWDEYWDRIEKKSD